MRPLLSVQLALPALLASLLTLAAGARAEEGSVASTAAKGFGRRGSFAVSVENVFGVVSERAKGVGDLLPADTLDSRGFFPGVLGVRIGLDGLDRSGFTFGVRLQTWWNRPSETDGNGLVFFGIEPRVGYAGAFSDKVGYWLRVGTSMYVPMTQPGAGYLIGLAGDALLVFTPTSHVGVTLGPSFEQSLAGHGAATGDASFRSFGVNLGLLADF